MINPKIKRVVHGRLASGCTETAGEMARGELHEVSSRLDCVREQLLQSTCETTALKEKLTASEQNSFMLDKALEEVKVKTISTILRIWTSGTAQQRSQRSTLESTCSSL